MEGRYWYLVTSNRAVQIPLPFTPFQGLPGPLSSNYRSNIKSSALKLLAQFLTSSQLTPQQVKYVQVFQV